MRMVMVLLAFVSMPAGAEVFSTSRCFPADVHSFPVGEFTSEVSALVKTSADSGFRFQPWTVQCDRGVQLVTLYPDRDLPSAPFVCQDAFRLVEPGHGPARVQLLADSGNAIRGLCGRLYQPITVMIQLAPEVGRLLSYETYDPLLLSYPDHEGRTISVEAISHAWTRTRIWRVWRYFRGTSSGMFWNAARSGEGLLLNLERLAPLDERLIVFLALFSYDQHGNPRWLVTNGVVDAETSHSFELPLLSTAGTGFGPDFDPDEVTRTIVGSVRVEENGCVAKRMVITGGSGYNWLTHDFGNLVRLTGTYETDCGEISIDRMWRQP